MTRLYDKINPPPLDLGNSKDVLTLLFYQRTDNDWLATISPEQWLRLHQLLAQDVDAETLRASIVHFQEQCLYAAEMLAIWVAAASCCAIVSSTPQACAAWARIRRWS